MTRVVPLTAETYRQVNNDPIGRARNNMQGQPPLPPGHAYGIKCIGSDSTVGDCLRGWYSKDEQLPDKDLGKSVVVGRRNQCQTGRNYGVPSIRDDIGAPRVRSVADAQNYGDEAGAAALLHPQRFELMGIPDEEFLLRRPKEELLSILECAEVPTKDFDFVYDGARQLFDDGEGTVSLDAYLYIQSELIDSGVSQAYDALPSAA